MVAPGGWSSRADGGSRWGAVAGVVDGPGPGGVVVVPASAQRGEVVHGRRAVGPRNGVVEVGVPHRGAAVGVAHGDHAPRRGCTGRCVAATRARTPHRSAPRGRRRTWPRRPVGRARPCHGRVGRPAAPHGPTIPSPATQQRPRRCRRARQPATRSRCGARGTCPAVRKGCDREGPDLPPEDPIRAIHDTRVRRPRAPPTDAGAGWSGARRRPAPAAACRPRSGRAARRSRT